MRKDHETSGYRFRKAGYILLGMALGGLLLVSPAPAAELDIFGPPPAGDPSEQKYPFIGLEFADNALRGVPPANEGSLLLQGGVQGTVADVGVNNVVQAPGIVRGGGDYNIPTNSRPSPLYGARSFTQQMLLFEEFGPEALNDDTPVASNPFPQPIDNQAGPAGASLEAFLAQAGIGPLPTRLANTVDLNPWKTAIESFLNRPVLAPPAEGRPPGEGWSHQRWNEFKPQSFFKTAQAGARTNGGFRDAKQRHGYSAGEFGPGGLYHKVYGTDNAAWPTLTGSTNGLGIRFHPLMPVQDPKAIWTFDGTLPPKLLMVRYGQPVLMRHYNALPIDPAANRGFGLHTITTHEHNGHSPAESDGFANAFFFPGQFYDYRWPIQLAGYDTINTGATDPRAAFPCAPGETLFVNDSTDNTVTPKTCENGSIRIRGDWRETMSTHWFHDHMLDFTAQNVYKGNAVMMNYYSALDRGNEGFIDNVNLRFPSGTALPWGNRDYDVNLVIGDKAWDQTGQLWFNIFNTDGFLGDHLFTNWLYHPYLEVRARRYRFRVLNGSVSRYFAIALVRQRNDTGGELAGPGGSGVSYDRVPFHMIANDGNILEHAVPFDGTSDLNRNGNSDEHKGQLPTQSIAERYDIIVDFSKHGILPGDKLYFVNTLEHRDGQGVKGQISLGNILSESYKAVVVLNGGVPEWSLDPAVGKFLEFRVQAYSGTDNSMNPDDYIPGPGKKTMIPLHIHSLPDGSEPPELANARHRSFTFARGGTDVSPWVIKTDENLSPLAPGFNMDPRRVSATPQLATGPTQAGYAEDVPYEVWTIDGGGGWDHPVHVHFEEGIYLSRGGKQPPEWERWARKDMYRIGPSPDSERPIVMAIRFREFAGTYVEHCHNTQHEDHAMLLRWDIEHPGQFTMMPTPLPTWDGVEYVDSAALPTVRTVQMYGSPTDGSPIDNVTPGATVVCAATLTGIPGTGPFEYKYQHRHPGQAWGLAQEWTPSDNLVWSTAAADYTAGDKYEMKVSVREVGKTALLGMATMPITMAAGAATGATLTPSPYGPQAPGTPVTWTAGASGGSGTYEYQIWHHNGSWSIVKDYNVAGNSWNWNTTGLPAGTYYALVYARNAGSTSDVEAVAFQPYTLATASTIPPATGATITPDPAGPQAPGTPVTWTAGASGGSGTYEYQIWYHNGSWSMVKDYNVAGNSWNWNTTALPAGTYHVLVYARSAGSTADVEAVAITPYNLVTPSAIPPATGVTLTPSPSSQPPGTRNPVTWTASASGGSGTYEYQIWFHNGSWSIAKDYNVAGDSWNWNTTGLANGRYHVLVYTRSAGSTADVEAVALTPYDLQ